MTLPLLNPALADVPPYVTAGPPPVGGTRLASNENPYGPSPDVQEALLHGIVDVSRYPDPSAWWLRERLGRHLSVDPARVLVGNGATELIDLIARAVLGPGQNTVYADPSFIMYRIAPKSMGAAVREVPLTDQGAFDLVGVLKAVDANTKLVYLANPNNPTGTYLDRRTLEWFCAVLPKHVVLVLDEAYSEYAVADDFPDGVELLNLRDRMVVVRTFSKCHGLAGLRVGYLIASQEMVQVLEHARLPFNVNALAQLAAGAALADPDHVRRCRDWNRQQMDRVTGVLQRLGFSITPSQANFLLVDFGRTGVVEALQKRGVMVRSMAPYRLPTSARITIGTAVENAVLCRALADIQAEQEKTAA